MKCRISITKNVNDISKNGYIKISDKLQERITYGYGVIYLGYCLYIMIGHVILLQPFFTSEKSNNINEPAEEGGDDDKLTAVNLQILRRLWLPDVEIINLKEFETHQVLTKLEGIWLNKDDNLVYAIATRITFICPMKFNAFPMDIQRCKFLVSCCLISMHTAIMRMSIQLFSTPIPLKYFSFYTLFVQFDCLENSFF